MTKSPCGSNQAPFSPSNTARETRFRRHTPLCVPHTSSIALAGPATTRTNKSCPIEPWRNDCSMTNERHHACNSNRPGLAWYATSTQPWCEQGLSAFRLHRRCDVPARVSMSTTRYVATQEPPTPSTCRRLALVMSSPQHSLLMPSPMSSAYALAEATRPMKKPAV